MPRLPVVSGEDCIAVLTGLGYSVIRQRGSHVRLTCPGRTPVTVPLHAELDRGTLRSIIQTAGLSVAEFCEARS